MDLDLFVSDETNRIGEILQVEGPIVAVEVADAIIKSEALDSIVEAGFHDAVFVDEHEQSTSKKRRGPRKKIRQCECCNEMFETLKDLRVHLKAHNRPHLPAIFACCECDRRFSWQSHIERHMKVHTGDRPFTCYACDKQFAQIGNLNTHVRTHTGDRPYTCDACGKRFSRIDNLNTHQRIHSSDRPYRCVLCPKAFLLPQQHAAHMRHHSGEKPYHCNECGRTFAQPQGLSKHAYVHLESRPYLCSECSLRFLAPDELRRHFALCHAGITTYVCIICEKSFSYVRAAHMHIRNHQNLRI
jgi:KRAB domain-containing zinc finger protein